jgi:hypothetical protein
MRKTIANTHLTPEQHLEGKIEIQALLFNHLKNYFPKIKLGHRMSGSNDVQGIKSNTLICENFICSDANIHFFKEVLTKAVKLVNNESKYHFSITKPIPHPKESVITAGIKILGGGNPQGEELKKNLNKVLTKLGALLAPLSGITVEPRVVQDPSFPVGTELLLGWYEDIYSVVRSDEQGLEAEHASYVPPANNVYKKNSAYHLQDLERVVHHKRERVGNIQEEGLKKGALLSLKRKLQLKGIKQCSQVNNGLKLLYLGYILQITPFALITDALLAKFKLKRLRYAVYANDLDLEVSSHKEIKIRLIEK